MRQPTARDRLLDAAIHAFRARGYDATSVEDLCSAVGVSKGAFFHHFRSKEDLALAAIERFLSWLDGIFARSGWRSAPDPRARVLAYIDQRIRMLDGEVPRVTCLLGMLVQETFATHPALRAACEAGFRSHLAPLESDLAEALAARPEAGFGAGSLARHVMAVIQGAFVLAKAHGGPDPARDALLHLRRYLEVLLGPAPMPAGAA